MALFKTKNKTFGSCYPFTFVAVPFSYVSCMLRVIRVINKQTKIYVASLTTINWNLHVGFNQPRRFPWYLLINWRTIVMPSCLHALPESPRRRRQTPADQQAMIWCWACTAVLNLCNRSWMTQLKSHYVACARALHPFKQEPPTHVRNKKCRLNVLLAWKM